MPLLFPTLLLACTSPPPPPVRVRVRVRVRVPVFVIDSSAAPAPPPPPPPPPLACATDTDCFYDPTLDRCTADPRGNRQPPLVDQGLVCFCSDALTCDALRVPPVPCESDASCAVRADPRPHPIAADRAHPRERAKPCRDFVFSTTCERTNICTMHRHACTEGRR